MSMTALNPTELQDQADDVVAGLAPACGVRREFLGIGFVCVMPPHGNADSYVNRHRRRKRGRPTQADRHYFTQEGTS